VTEGKFDDRIRAERWLGFEDDSTLKVNVSKQSNDQWSAESLDKAAAWQPCQNDSLKAMTA